MNARVLVLGMALAGILPAASFAASAPESAALDRYAIFHPDGRVARGAQAAEERLETQHPVQGWRAAFEAGGVRFERAGQTLMLAWAGWGRENKRDAESFGQAGPAVTPHVCGRRVEFARGAVVEWYEYGPAGLEQGFTLAAPPEGTDTGALQVRLRLEGNLVPRLESASVLQLYESSGRSAFRYDGLKAWDARGEILPAWMELDGQALALCVDDRGAAYPVTIDPLVSSELTAADGKAGDRFGAAVAVSGDTLLVGAPGIGTEPGAAYVFIRSGGAWTLQQKLTAADGVAGMADRFGGSVALDGDTALLGAFAATIDGKANQGAAYVFVRSGGVWTQQAKLTAGDGAANDILGGVDGVALRGDRAVAGADGAPGPAGAGQGAVYVFARSGGVWSQEAKLQASDGAAGDNLGESVAVSGDTILAGATGRDLNATALSAGAAYVFVKVGGVWTQEARLMAADAAGSDFFGQSVAVLGNQAAIGSPRDNIGSLNDQGSVYVFTRAGTVWTQATKLLASDGAAGDGFGRSLALMDGRLAVGADLDNAGTGLNQGSLYLFFGQAGTWTESVHLSASNPQTDEHLGRSVGLGADVIAGGAPDRDGVAGADQGSVFVFQNTGPVISSPATAAPNPANVFQLVTFSGAAADPDGDAVNFLWDFGDGSTGTGAMVTHRYVAEGVYTAILRANDGISVTLSQVTVTITTMNNSTATLAFNELYANKPKKFREEGESFVEDTEAGKFSISATLVLNEDITAFNGDTTFVVRLGNFNWEGALKDDPKFAAGKTSVKLTRAEDIGEEKEKLFKFLNASLKWKPGLLTVKIKVVTAKGFNAFFDPVIADTFLGQPTGTATANLEGALAFSQTVAVFSRPVTIAIKSKVKETKEDTLMTSAVKVASKGPLAP